MKCSYLQVHTVKRSRKTEILLALTPCKRGIWIFPPLSADGLKWIHSGLQLLLYVRFENFRIILKQKVTSRNKSHCTLSKCTVVVNGRKIQIPIFRGVNANKISVFLKLITVLAEWYLEQSQGWNTKITRLNLLGTPDTSLSGLSTLMARSVLRSNPLASSFSDSMASARLKVVASSEFSLRMVMYL